MVAEGIRRVVAIIATFGFRNFFAKEINCGIVAMLAIREGNLSHSSELLNFNKKWISKNNKAVGYCRKEPPCKDWQ